MGRYNFRLIDAVRLINLFIMRNQIGCPMFDANNIIPIYKNLFVRNYSFKGLTFIISLFNYINILSIISHGFSYSIPISTRVYILFIKFRNVGM